MSAELDPRLAAAAAPSSGYTGRSSSGTRWEPPTPEQLQGSLANYDVVGLLGRGGMGAVYKGWQRSLDRFVAIKVLPPDLDDGDAQFTARFKQEAKTMARLSHPGIVSVIDSGETADGLLYMVMEFIEGTDVSEMVKGQGRIAPEHALSIVAHVCEALDYAHKNHVIHRDIKPANVMMDTQGRVKVADFGLAKAVNSGQTALTGTNMVMGTPDFIAPEALILGVDVDHRADLYAIGVMLYQMLTGKVPRGRFEPASARVPGLDPRFDGIIDRAMQEDREARYSSAADIQSDLMNILHTPQQVPVEQPTLPLSAAALPEPHAASAAMSRAPSVTRRTAGPALQTRMVPATTYVEEKKSPVGLLVTVLALVAGGVGVWMWKPWLTKETTAAAVSSTATGAQTTTASAPPASSTATTAATTEPSPAVKAVPKPAEPTAPAAAVATMPTPSPAAAAPAAPAPAPETSSIPELAALQQQFDKLRAERVDAPFNSGVATLTAGYSGGITRAISEEQKAGHLDGVVALQGESKRVASGQEMPADDAGAPESLRKLRSIYRAEVAKLEKQRSTNLLALTGPLAKRLQQLEADLTKLNRIPDARSVRAYREKIAPAGEQALAATTPPVGSPAPTPGKASAAAEWIDILSQVDVAKHALAGEWEMKNGRLHSGRSEWPMCELPVDYDGGNYDLELEVERVSGNTIGFFFAFRKDNSGGTVVFDYFNGAQADRYNQMKVAGIEHLNGVMAWDGNGTQVTRPQWIVLGKKYTVLFQVRDEGVAVKLDDEEVIRWTGDWFMLQQRGSFHNSTNNRRVFGLGAFQCEIEVSSAKFRSIKGAEGKKLPPAKSR